MQRIAFLLALALAGCAEEAIDAPAGSITRRLEELGAGRYVGIAPAETDDRGAYAVHRFDPAGPARCLEGTDFYVTTRDGTAPEAMLFLEGGGACWDAVSCFETKTAKTTSSGAAWENLRGILDPGQASNAFRGWNMVYASYCDGSVWSGDAEAVYGGRKVYHHGLANLSAAVTLLKKKYPSPPKIVVTGSSAGGYGTLMGYMVVRSQFPDTPIYVVNDSGPWIFNPENTDMTEQSLDNWGVRKFFPAECAKCQDQMYYFADWAMNRDPRSTWGIFSYDNDFTIGTLYLEYGGDFTRVLDEVTAGLRDRHPGRFNAFLLRGSKHTIFMEDAYYEAARDGYGVDEWVEAMVSDDAAWRDVRGSD